MLATAFQLFGGVQMLHTKNMMHAIAFHLFFESSDPVRKLKDQKYDACYHISGCWWVRCCKTKYLMLAITFRLFSVSADPVRKSKHQNMLLATIIQLFAGV